MKHFLTIFFVTLGVIFFVILCLLAYLWFADPFELRPLITEMKPAAMESSATTSPVSGEEESLTPAPVANDKNPNLTPAQEDALTLIGIDPAGLPSTITPEQYSCFVRVLGETRVQEIQAGDAPSPIEIFKAKECI